MGTLAFLLQTAVVTRALFLMPFEGKRRYQKLKADVARDALARARFFRRFIVTWWVVALAVLISTRFSLSELGVVPMRGLGAWGVIAGWLLLLSWPVLRARSSAPYREAVREQLQRVPALLPGTKEERWLFAAVSITAGVCEELVFRGLMPLYFAHFFPTHGHALGLGISIVGFGVAHWYQGVRGVVLATLLGGLFAFGAWASGSVAAAMIFHAANDLRFLALILALERPLPDKA